MRNTVYREAYLIDVPFLASVRAANSGNLEFWNKRIHSYLEGSHHPQQALIPRIIYVASVNTDIIGFVAGHLTRRYGCDGELQWIDVLENYRRGGTASQLIKILARWFIDQKAKKICVDPGNEAVRKFYEKNGAETLNEHWMVWKDIGRIL